MIKSESNMDDLLQITQEEFGGDEMEKEAEWIENLTSHLRE